jgi:hypothetical protein
MTLPEGYSDIPAGKIAAVVTHLEMTARPPLRPDPPGAWTVRRAETPDTNWYRDLYCRVGEEWLCFSRLQMADAELAAIIHSPLVEVYALGEGGRDEGLLGAGFSRIRPVRTVVLRRHIKTGESRAGIGVVAAGRAGLGAYLYAKSSLGAGFLSARGVLCVPAAGRDCGRSAAGWDSAAACREARTGY